MPLFGQKILKSNAFLTDIEIFLLTLQVNKTQIMTKKILFINQEITPYVPESSLSKMGLQLPSAVQEKGCEIRTFMPKWGNINERRGQLHEVIRLSGMNLIINDTDHPLIIKVASVQSSRLQVYFIDNDDYFAKRLMGTDDKGEEYDDNGERAIFFARGVLETVKKLRWVPDVIHCQGWMSSVVPLYVKTAYRDEPSFTNTKVVTSLFADSLKQSLNADFKKCLEFREASADALAKYPDIFAPEDLGRLAVDFSDGIIAAEENVGTLFDYAKAAGKQILDYQSEDFAVACQSFYDMVCGEDSAK